MEISLFNDLLLSYDYFWVVSDERDAIVHILYVLEKTEKVITVDLQPTLWEAVLWRAWMLLQINLKQDSLEWKKFTYTILNKKQVLAEIRKSHKHHEFRKIDREKISVYKRISMDEYLIHRRKLLENEFLRCKWIWCIPMQKREELFSNIYKKIEYNFLSGKFSK